MKDKNPPYSLLNVKWTDKQRAQLQPHFDALAAANRVAPLGECAAMLGQVYPDGVFVRTLTHEQTVRVAKAIAEALGSPEPSMTASHSTASGRIAAHSGAGKARH